MSPDRTSELRGNSEVPQNSIDSPTGRGSERFLTRFVHDIKDFGISFTGQLIGAGIVALSLIVLFPYLNVDFNKPPANFIEGLKGTALLAYTTLGVVGGMIAGQEIAHKLLDPKQNLAGS